MSPFGDTVDIDLSTGTAVRRRADEADLELVLGGRGLNVLHLMRMGIADVDPLSADNPLLITPGLLTGTPAPSSSRLHVSARSPLTGLLGSSNIGGAAGQALHAVGIGCLILRGRAAAPVYLLVDDEHVELRDAVGLWGLDTSETQERLTAWHGTRTEHAHEQPAILAIGSAGENLARLACIMTEGGHAAGRTGMGAVMGAKRLKAVVICTPKCSENSAGAAGTSVSGKSPPSTEVHAAVKRYLALVTGAPNYGELREFGLTASVRWCNDLGMLATRNYTAPQFAGAAATDGTSLERYVSRKHGCRGCPMRCKAEVRVQSGRFAGLAGERPDFEPLVAWGAKVGVDDPEAVVYLHNRCDRLGLDSISAGAAVAFAVELYERGIIDQSDTGGLELTWGDAQALSSLIDGMAAGCGLGGLLSDGVRNAAKAIGRSAERYAYEVKGLELPAYDPRGAFGAALSYAVSPRGGDFAAISARQEFNLTPADAARLYGDERAADPVSPGGKAPLVRAAWLASSALDALGLCKRSALTLLNDYRLEATADLAAGVTGLPLTPGRLLAVGERIAVLERLFDLRCGMAASDDTLPPAFAEPLTAGPRAGSAVDVRAMRDEFYCLMGWSPDGVPTPATLERLGLDQALADHPKET